MVCSAPRSACRLGSQQLLRQRQGARVLGQVLEEACPFGERADGATASAVAGSVTIVCTEVMGLELHVGDDVGRAMTGAIAPSGASRAGKSA